MVNINLLVTGKLKESYFKEEVNEYLKRLSKYCKIKITEVNDEKIKDQASQKEEELVKIKEGKNLLKNIKENDYVILLDLHGEELESIAFSKKIEQIINKSSSLTLVIAGSLGFSQEVIDRADYRFSLSKLTFTHQMTRVIILEQLYRAFKIINNETYHK